jgi:hypothetical protein
MPGDFDQVALVVRSKSDATGVERLALFDYIQGQTVAASETRVEPRASNELTDLLDALGGHLLEQMNIAPTRCQRVRS